MGGAGDAVGGPDGAREILVPEREAGALGILVAERNHGRARVDHDLDRAPVYVGFCIEVAVVGGLDLDERAHAHCRLHVIGAGGAALAHGDVVRRRQAKHALGARLQAVEVDDGGNANEGNDAPARDFAHQLSGAAGQRHVNEIPAQARAAKRGHLAPKS